MNAARPFSQLSDVLGSDGAHDCIAVCAPNAIISVSLLYERIFLQPHSNEFGSTSISSDEVYDLLVTAENKPVSRLIFVSPHVLFSGQDSVNTLSRSVSVLALDDPAVINWHLARPIAGDNEARAVILHSRYTGINEPPFATFSGVDKPGRLRFPPKLSDPDSLEVLLALKRTVFECEFEPPITVGEKRWVRLRISPDTLAVAAPLLTPSDKTGLLTHSQTLDILGPDTMLEAFEDLMGAMRHIEALPDPGWLDERRKRGISNLNSYLWDAGFNAPGTYTRILDHRIILVPSQCRVTLLDTQGNVNLHSILPLQINGEGLPAFSWHAGLAEFWQRDPVVIAEKIYDYLLKYANVSHLAKPKPVITYAVGVDHILGCEVISSLAEEGYIWSHSSGDLYWSGEGRRLPSGGSERQRQIIALLERKIESFRKARNHFRIWYESSWG